MFRLIKSLFTLVGFVVCVAAALFFFRKPIAKEALAQLIAKRTGFPATVEEADFDPTRGLVIARNVRVLNPGQWEHQPCADLRTLAFELDVNRLTEGAIVIRRMWVDFAQFNLVQNIRGEFNVQALAGLALSDEEATGVSTLSSGGPSGAPVAYLEVTADEVHFHGNKDATDGSSGPSVRIKGEAVRDLRGNAEIQRAVVAILLRKLDVQVPGLPRAAMDALLGRTAEVQPSAPPVPGVPAIEPSTP